MKKKLIYILLPIFIIGYFLYEAYQYYSPPQIHEIYSISKPPTDTLSIAFIGDSWAYLHNRHKCIIPKQIESAIKRPVKIKSIGISRLTSKELYKSIYDNKEMRVLFQTNHFDYCIIATGVNDTDNKMSTSYYINSMEGIIHFMLANQIKPIIIEIPDYDMSKTFMNQGKAKMVLRYISMFINNTPKDCKQLFRDALRRHIHKKNYDNSVIIIDYKSWNPDFKRDLETLYQKDGLHLNNEGYKSLDKAIVKEIIKEERL